MKVTCNYDSMDVKVKSKLFGLTKADAAKVSPKPTLHDGDAEGFDFQSSCPLGECGMTYKIQDEK